MADLSNPISGLYPAPPQQAPSLFSDPARLASFMSTANALQQSKAEFAAKQAVGSAYQSALNPDGSVDVARLSTGLQNPDAALGAAEAVSNLPSLREKQSQAATAQLTAAAGQNNYIMNGLGSLADNPNVTGDDVRNFAVNLTRNSGIPTATVSGWLSGLPEGGPQLQSALRTMAHVAIGPTGLATRVAGPPNTQGQPTQMSLGQADNLGSTPTGLSPGQSSASSVAGQGSAEQGIALQKAADGSPVRKAMLGNLSADLDKFTSGPGADWNLVGKAWLNRNVLPTGMQFDPQSIASQEAFIKQSVQLAQQQWSALGGTGTDQQLNSQYKSNPSDYFSKLGNKQIMELLNGNEDALTAKASAWQRWQQKNGLSSYGAFQQDFNRNFNPRVYQSLNMTPDELLSMRKSMSSDEQKRFARDYTVLKNKGYLFGGDDGQQQ